MYTNDDIKRIRKEYQDLKEYEYKLMKDFDNKEISISFTVEEFFNLNLLVNSNLSMNLLSISIKTKLNDILNKIRKLREELLYKDNIGKDC